MHTGIEQQIQARQAGQVVVLMPSVEDEMVIDGDDSRPLKRRKTLLGEDAMPNESSYAGGGCVDGSDHEQLPPCHVLGSRVNELEQPANSNIVVAEPDSAQADLERARRRKDDASAKLLYLKERKDELQTEKNGMCSKIRSQVSIFLSFRMTAAYYSQILFLMCSMPEKTWKMISGLASKI